MREHPVTRAPLVRAEVGALQGVGAIFWTWYRAHAEDKILTVKILFISKTIRVRDLRFLFVQLFGEPPV